MKKVAIALLVLVAATAAFAAEARKQSYSFPATGLDRVKLELPVGDIVVTAAASNQVRIDMVVRCSSMSSRCREIAKEIELASDRFGSSLDLEIDGYPEHGSGSPSVDLTIWMPASVAFKSEVGVGDTTVKGMEGDVEVSSGVGHVTLNGFENKVRSVHLESGLGSAKMWVKKRPIDVPGLLFLGHELDWNEGKGNGRVEVEAGVGSVRVSID